MGIKRDPLKIIICGAGIGGLTAAIAFRQQGHEVTIYEQSRFSNEIGAAIHIPPNAYSMLNHLNVPFDKLGGNPTEYVTEYDIKGNQVMHVVVNDLMKDYTYPWLLVHRADLHTALKNKATSEKEKGYPVKIVLSSRIREINPDTACITLETGETYAGDVLVAADGVHSVARKYITGSNQQAEPSGNSAFRFLIKKEDAMMIDELNDYLKKTGELQIWMGDKRRVVIYPCRDNELLNFVCIHPDSENSGSTEGWSNAGSVDDLLECFKDFPSGLRQLLAKAQDIKLWKLLDRETLNTWIKGKAALLGDAAHSFLPHQGQGGAQAIEDAVALATMFPLGIEPHDVPEHLVLYEKARLERAHTIQKFTRDQAYSPKEGKPLNAIKFSHYNWSHDAYFNARKLLTRYLEAKCYKRMPIGWGPLQGPRQDHLGKPFDGSSSYLRTGSIRIKTTKSYLEHLLPNDRFFIDVPGEVAYITFSNTWIDNIDWLGGRDYSHFDFYIEDVVYLTKDGRHIKGRCLPLLLEGRTEPTLSGREELGFAKIYTSLTESFDEKDGYKIICSWEGTKFMEMMISQPEQSTTNSQIKSKAEATMEWRCIPNPRGKGKTDIEYATYTPEPTGGADFKLTKIFEGYPKITFFPENITPEKLPCHYNVAKRISEIPIFELQKGKVTIGTGLSDVSNQSVLEDYFEQTE